MTVRSYQRVMNSQMNIALPMELHEKLRDLAWQERLSISALCRELIEAGMQLREEETVSESKSGAVGVGG